MSKGIWALLSLLGLALLFSVAAGEQAENRVVMWHVRAAEIRTDALLEATFGGNGATAAEIGVETLDSGAQLWQLAGQDGLPFCGTGPAYTGSAGIQTSFYIYRHEASGEERTYFYHLNKWNTIPSESGFGASRAEETFRKAGELLAALGLTEGAAEATPLFFTTMGSMEGTVKSRVAVFEETLEGLPVRWEAEALSADESVPMAEKCTAEVIYSDEDGLLTASGTWCDFEPLAHAVTVLSREEAAKLFAEIGKGGEPPEACWFLSFTGQDAFAILAWRVDNTYLDAEAGRWLQTEN